MGVKSSKCKVGKSKEVEPISTQRENMATWHRTDIPVTDVYDIVEIIGKGRMGEVYKVRRHVEDRGLHNPDTRSKSFGLDVSDHSIKRDASIKRSTSNPPISRMGSEKRLPSAESITHSKPKPILRKSSRGNLVKIAQAGTVLDRDDSSYGSVKDLGDGLKPLDENEIGKSPSKSISYVFDTDDEDNMSSSSNAPETPWKRKKSRKSRLRFQRHYACKTVITGGLKAKQLKKMMNEIYIMRTLDHPYIIRLYEVYQVKERIWMVMDLCSGGDLSSRKLNESQVVTVAEQILRGVVYCTEIMCAIKTSSSKTFYMSITAQMHRFASSTLEFLKNTIKWETLVNPM